MSYEKRIYNYAIGNSKVVAREVHRPDGFGGTFGNYFDFVTHNVCKVIEELQPNISVSIDCEESLCDINIALQYEHAIYTPDQTTYEIAPGFEPFINNLCSKKDLIIEYSNPNIHFLSAYTDLEYNKKVVYVPNLYTFENTNTNPTREKSVTTFHNWTSRRMRLAERMKVDNFYSYKMEDIKTTLDGYKVLLNVQQNDNHKTFNDIRCCPLLKTKVLIVSDNDGMPFLETVPYHKHIIWVPFDEIPSTVEHIINNYEDYQRIYLNGIDDTINDLYVMAYNNIKASIMKLL